MNEPLEPFRPTPSTSPAGEESESTTGPPPLEFEVSPPRPQYQPEQSTSAPAGVLAAPGGNASTDVPSAFGGSACEVSTTGGVPEVSSEPETASEVRTEVSPGSIDEPETTRRLRPLPRVIALANQKGGVGKTTTTVNLAASLAEQDHRVLVVDLDPQGNATTGLGINARTLENSVYDVLLHDVAIEDCVESTAVLNLFVLPASLDLAGAEIELVSVMSRENRLRLALADVRDDYDYILIDCPPSLGLLTVNALAAASEVMVPIQCEYYALEGLAQLIRNIDLVQKNLNPSLELSAIVLVMYDGRTKLGEQVAAEVRGHFGDRVCRNVIPRNIRLSEAPSFGQPITTFDSSSKGAVAYRELAREVHNGSA